METIGYKSGVASDLGNPSVPACGVPLAEHAEPVRQGSPVSSQCEFDSRRPLHSIAGDTRSDRVGQGKRVVIRLCVLGCLLGGSHEGSDGGGA